MTPFTDQYTGIPANTQQALTLWATRGIRPGRFLRAVLNNDLCEAVMTADADNLINLKLIVTYVTNEINSSPDAEAATHQTSTI